MGGGAWPFLVGGVICLVYSDNERDLNLLNSILKRLLGDGFSFGGTLILGAFYLCFLEGQVMKSHWMLEAITGSKTQACDSGL
jgi:hypothetical protein